MNKGFGKTRTPAHTALVVLALESQLLITRCLLFSCGSSAGYDLQFSFLLLKEGFDLGNERLKFLKNVRICI